ncbi:MAG: NUDIX domain-containing protein [Oscillospiraceae bacterium]|nr:NUDIX domain-containing protein [Oscillospiraceae bacterium]
MMEEIFDILDENGEVSGETAPRSFVHKNGLYHRTAHIWLIKDGMVLLQRRSPDKDSFPGRLDISSAGHISAGEEPLISAVRELSEELGILASPSELRLIGKISRHYMKRFRGEIFDDRELAFVYLFTGEYELSQIKIQRSEISEVGLYPIEKCLRLAGDDDEPLNAREIELLRDIIASGYDYIQK